MSLRRILHNANPKLPDPKYAVAGSGLWELIASSVSVYVGHQVGEPELVSAEFVAHTQNLNLKIVCQPNVGRAGRCSYLILDLAREGANRGDAEGGRERCPACRQERVPLSLRDNVLRLCSATSSRAAGQGALRILTEHSEVGSYASNGQRPVHFVRCKGSWILPWFLLRQVSAMQGSGAQSRWQTL